tara:strand:+ start:265 stop:534 length:270 start_codon:yes stop_codon:yes gene_type:complete
MNGSIPLLCTNFTTRARRVLMTTITLPDGNTFIGEFKNGVRNGMGIKFYPNGATYTGCWVNDIRHGKGVKIHANGTRVEVEYVNGEKII